MKVLYCNPAVVAVGVANPLDLVLMPASVGCMLLENLLNFVVSIVRTGVECSQGCSFEWLDPLNVDSQLIPAVWLLKNHHLRAEYLNNGVGTCPLLTIYNLDIK